MSPPFAKAVPFTQREERIATIVEAIEEFIAAKAAYERTYASGAEYVSTHELDRARDNLTETLENCL